MKRCDVLQTTSEQFVDPNDFMDLDTIWLCGQMGAVKAMLKRDYPFAHEYESPNSNHINEAIEYIDSTGGFSDAWTGICYVSQRSTNSMIGGFQTYTFKSSIEHFVAFKNEADMIKYKLSTNQNDT